MVGRLALWLNMQGWELDGGGKLTGLVVVSPKSIELQEFTLAADRLHIWQPAIFMDEPHVEVVTAGSWNRATGELDLPSIAATAGQVSVQVANFHCAPKPGGAGSTSGTLTYSAELGQVSRWTRDPRRPGVWNLSGLASGRGEFKIDSGLSTVQLDGTINNFELVAVAPPPQRAPVQPLFKAAAAPPPPPAWREQQLKIAVRGSYDPSQDLLQMAQAEVASNALRCSVKGTVGACSSEQDLDLRGELEYDWQTLAPLLRPYLGPGVNISGHETRPFMLHGPWAAAVGKKQWQAMTGNCSIGWEGANLYGLPIGPGILVGSLANSLIQFQPLKLDVSQGYVNINEQIRILPAPGEIRLSKGRLVDQVQVTPEVCARR